MENKINACMAGLTRIKGEIEERLNRASDADAPNLCHVLINVEKEILNFEILKIQQGLKNSNLVTPKGN